MLYLAPYCEILDLALSQSLMQTSIGDWNIDPDPLTP
jgi:hypothetical protein